MSEILTNSISGGRGHSTILTVHPSSIARKRKTEDDEPEPAAVEDSNSRAVNQSPNSSADLEPHTQASVAWTLWSARQMQLTQPPTNPDPEECERRPNKRKNFRPRNIRAVETTDCDSDQELKDQFRRTLLPQKMFEKSNDVSSDPVDLSCKITTEHDTDDDSSDKLSVVSPTQWLDSTNAEWSNQDSNDENQNKHGLGMRSEYDRFLNENCPKNGSVRDMLSMYGLPGEMVNRLARSFQREDADSPSPSPPPSQPPTPPETPKNPAFQPGYRDPMPSSMSSENTLAALHAHMQSVLRSVGAPRSPSPTSSISNSETSESHGRQGAQSTLHASGMGRPNSSEMLSYLQSLSMSNSLQPSSSSQGRSDHHSSSQRGTSGEASSGPSASILESSKFSISSQPSVSASVGNRIGHPANKQGGPVDYTRYVKRFSSAIECGSNYCKDLNYREHFHCLDCNTRVFVKKEEMIRHFKWHKKRDESLQHGFMRYSPMDDCGDMFSRCTHNRKQTHYHCLKDGCDKVYISTSDVQMHANYHRKDSAIMQEGFQRYRGSEDCRQQHCPFAGQHTTHFHCRRQGCLFTFKNKADMEKHKTYHAKDEQLSRDGFKKFMKTESCSYDACRFSKVCNHIHCIRPGCNYVLHSSGQLYSHKRKHERRDTEIAYRNYKIAHGGMIRMGDNDGIMSIEQVPFSPDGDMPHSISATAMHQAALAASLQANLEQQMALGMGFALGPDQSPFQLPLGLNPHQMALIEAQRAAMLAEERKHFDRDADHSASPTPTKMHPDRHSPDESPRKQRQESSDQRLSSPVERDDVSSPEAMDLTQGNNQQDVATEESSDWKIAFSFIPEKVECRLDCLLLRKDHYHCREEECSMVFRSSDGAREHHANHRHQDLITTMFYVTVRHGQTRCPYAQDCQHISKLVHYHCLWEDCSEVIFSGDKPFRRLDHFKMHEYSKRVNLAESPKEIPSQPNESGINNFLDSMFRRKRGRPPKNRVIEMSLPSGSNNGEGPQAIYASFKLPKPTTSPTRESPLPISLSANHRLQSPSPTRTVLPRGVLRPPTPAALEGKKNVQINENVLTVADATECPFLPCQFSKSLHYHCLFPRCGFTTDGADVISTHRHQPIMEGFAAFGDSSECGHPRCISSRLHQHFHCLRPGCSFISVRADAMLIHDREHNMLAGVSSETSDGRESRTPNSGNEPRPASENEAESPLRATVVRAAGTFYPIPTPGSSSPPVRQYETKIDIDEKPQLYGPEQSCGRPFCKLKRREHYHCSVCNQAFSEVERLKPHMKKHSDDVLSPSVTHRVVDEDRSSETSDHRDDEEDRVNGDKAPERGLDFSSGSKPAAEMHSMAPTPNLIPDDAYIGMGGHPLQSLSAFVAPMHPYGYMGPHFMGPHGFNPLLFGPPGQGYMLPGPPLPFPTSVLPPMPSSPMDVHPPSRKRGDTPTPNPSTPESPWDPKKIRAPTNTRILKEEPVPEGYIRFRFNEDCRYPQCGYREHQTHFHCTRIDCGYSFCDKTRFVQHTARHERLDTLMGGDFSQYRASIPCGRQGCLHIASLGSVQNKASHFHCLKCDFVCTDTNKVVAHRRQHQKQDSILAAGFEKFTPSQSCRNETCPHNNKQTHYHCLKCSYVVLGLSQMSAHKYRHMD